MYSIWRAEKVWRAKEKKNYLLSAKENTPDKTFDFAEYFIFYTR